MHINSAGLYNVPEGSSAPPSSRHSTGSVEASFLHVCLMCVPQTWPGLNKSRVQMQPMLLTSPAPCPSVEADGNAHNESWWWRSLLLLHAEESGTEIFSSFVVLQSFSASFRKKRSELLPFKSMQFWFVIFFQGISLVFFSNELLLKAKLRVISRSRVPHGFPGAFQACQKIF